MISYRKRSFVKRNSRITAGQQSAYESLWPLYGLSSRGENIHINNHNYLEIGFGSGNSLLALALGRPADFFFGIETYKPGIGILLRHINEKKITNLKIYDDDAVEIFTHAVPEKSLNGINIFFPDPWQKRKHHDRRIIQSSFIPTLITRLKPNGTLHLATDWEDYAKQMMRLLSSFSALKNLAGAGQFAQRSPFRPIETKFEMRALREGRQIWELQFGRIGMVSS